MGNSMYDKNEIEDSLEFCRQIKEYEDISATDKGTANESHGIIFCKNRIR